MGLDKLIIGKMPYIPEMDSAEPFHTPNSLLWFNSFGKNCLYTFGQAALLTPIVNQKWKEVTSTEGDKYSQGVQIYIV